MENVRHHIPAIAPSLFFLELRVFTLTELGLLTLHKGFGHYRGSLTVKELKYLVQQRKLPNYTDVITQNIR